MNVSAIASRAAGYYPLSIATSLALEGAMGIHPDQPHGKVVLPQYEVLWVNLKTIFRNFYRAIDREQVLNVRPQDMAQGILEELESLENVVSELTGGKLVVQYYVSDYANLETKYRYAKVRGYTTELQKSYGGAMQYSLSPVIQAIKDRIKVYRLKITDAEPRKTLLFTNYAYDLLARGFPKLHLFESHTGAIKGPHQFYTKYHDGKSLQLIPWREDMLQIFGDSEHFHPMSKKVRDTVLAIAEKYRWSQVTTTAKVRYGIDQIQDPYLRDVLRAIITD
jgi:hypothetical protein